MAIDTTTPIPLGPARKRRIIGEGTACQNRPALVEANPTPDRLPPITTAETAAIRLKLIIICLLIDLFLS